MSKILLTWDDTNGVTNVVRADALMSLKDERTAEVTEHPIETGGEVTDHILFNAPRLSLTVFQSNTPIEEEDGFSRQKVNLQKYVVPSRFKAKGLLLVHSAVGNLVGALLSGAAQPLSVYVLAADTSKDRILELHDKLITAFQNGSECKVERFGRVYDGYVLTEVTYSRDAGRGGLGQFQLELRTVRKVATATTTLPDPEKLHVKASENRGKKPPKKIDSSKEDNRTLLAQIADSVGGQIVIE